VAFERRVTAPRGHPWLRLRDTPVGRIEVGFVGAGDPGIAARAVVVLHVAPRVGAALVAGCDRTAPPELVHIFLFVRADEALLLAVACAVAEALDELPLDDDRAA